MKKLTIVFLCVFTLLCAAYGAEAANQTIRVSDAREFLEALGSDRIIEMDCTGDYNLSQWDPYFEIKKDEPKLERGVSWSALGGGFAWLAPSKDESWSQLYKGGELTLRGIKNLTIRGGGPEGARAEIIVNPRIAFVMRFENCSGITIDGVSAGHSEGGGCLGGVFSFLDSSRITITDARIYGCGTEGLLLSNVSGVKVTDSSIYDCTYYIMTVSGGENIAFEDCVFMDNQEFSLINVSGTRNMSFSKCYFNDNRGEQMFEVKGTAISVSNSSFNRNKTNSLIQDSKNVKFKDCKFAISEDFVELCKLGTAQQVKTAIGNGADVNARDDNGWTVLMHAAAYGNNPETVAVLLENGAEVNAGDKSGLTALLRAAEYNPNPEVISILLKNGANVSAISRFGVSLSALTSAAYNPNPEVITVLLKNGMDVNEQSGPGYTALMHAASMNPNPAVVSVLLKNGADVNAISESGATALISAAQNNPNPEIISILLKSGADAKAKDTDGKRAIDYASENAGIKGTKAYKELADASK